MQLMTWNLNYPHYQITPLNIIENKVDALAQNDVVGNSPLNQLNMLISGMTSLCSKYLGKGR
jgi:hypothetical protein